ncbi:hypothetical protein L1N85_06365 [Paenibacillus alkaliterrae]|uniref:hypothetical protein n=1 Tax=Paenibacillus alkaliterrae TaxID=320909 RepID=UPI001F225099|nr:hypothetical protein [Paenibacillus alkaliterrae]MCF2938054.1 hypothetical protein [Paenibacillus alkaliterrae]
MILKKRFLEVKTALERAVILLLVAVFIAGHLTHWELLSPILGSLVFIAVALMLPQLRGMTLWLTVSFIAFGVILLILQKADAGFWLNAAGINVTLVTLFVFAPLFGIPVRLPDYIESLNRFYETKVRNRSVLFAGTQLLTQIMGVFLNVGSIPVVYHVVFAKPQPGMSRLLANALNRGFAGAIFWSPYFAAMAVVITSLSINWSTLLPYMLGLSMVSILVSLAVDFKGLRHTESTLSQAEREVIELAGPAANKGKAVFPAGLGVYLASAIVVILVLERLVELPMVMITCMAAVLFPLIWCFAKGAMETYRQGLKNHVTVTLPALKKEMTLFLAAGFFSGSIGATGFGASVPGLLELIPLPISVSFSVCTVALITVTSMVGLHPIVLVTILATGIDPAVVHISPNYFAVLLLGSWGLSNTVSPASAVNNLLAGVFKKPVFEFTLANYKFAACMAVVLLLYLAAVRI